LVVAVFRVGFRELRLTDFCSSLNSARLGSMVLQF
jgi:hypothetical protein